MTTGQKETKKALITGGLNRYCKEYGTIRVAKLVTDGVGDTLVLFSPPMQIPGDAPGLAAVTVLDGRLYEMMVETFGSVSNAVRELGYEIMSYHFTESEQEGERCAAATL